MIVFTLIGAALFACYIVARAIRSHARRVERDQRELAAWKPLAEFVNNAEHPVPPSRYTHGHPPEPGEPRAR